MKCRKVVSVFFAGNLSLMIKKLMAVHMFFSCSVFLVLSFLMIIKRKECPRLGITFPLAR